MKNLFFLSLFLLPHFVQAQSGMTLDECIRLAWKQNPSVRNSVIDIKEARADYMAAVGAFLPRAAVNAETGKRFGRSIDPDTNGYTNETFEEGTVGLDMTLSLFEGFSRIHQVRFRKMNKERSEWALKNKQNELAYQVTDAYYKLILERKLLNLALEQSRLSERYLKQTEAFVELGLKSASDLQEVKARREGDIYRYKSRENTCRLALLHLEQLMNFQPGDTLVIQDTIVEANQLPLLSVPSTEILYAQSLEILPAILNTVYVIIATLIFILPLGVGSAIYLTEYATNKRLVAVIEFATETLSGMPSIIFALVGVIVFCELFGLGISLIAGAFSLVMMTLPTVIRTTQESLKTVPQSYREGSLALGSGKWHMIRTVVLPSSVDGIVTGCILAVGRIVGESAVLMFTAGMGMRLAKYGDTVGEFFTNLFDSSGATLTVALYNYAKERADFDSAFAVAVVLLVIAFVINIAAKLAGKKLKNR